MDEKLETAIMDCFAEIYPRISRDVWSILAGMPEDELAVHHFGLGLYLRNNVLAPKSELYKLFVEEGIDHKDDMSSLMIQQWHKALSGQREAGRAGRGQIQNHIWMVTMMEATGITRKIDELGRIVLPIEARGKFDLKDKDSVEIFTDEGGIYLKPVDNERCVFCKEKADLIPQGGRYICRACLAKINEQAVTGIASEQL